MQPLKHVPWQSLHEQPQIPYVRQLHLGQVKCGFDCPLSPALHQPDIAKSNKMISASGGSNIRAGTCNSCHTARHLLFQAQLSWAWCQTYLNCFKPAVSDLDVFGLMMCAVENALNRHSPQPLPLQLDSLSNSSLSTSFPCRYFTVRGGLC